MLHPLYRYPLYLGGGTRIKRNLRHGKKAPWHDSMSDGCSVVSDPPEIIHCCLAHDKGYYEEGGVANFKKYGLMRQERRRIKIDRYFRDCMLATDFSVFRSWVRCIGVLILGSVAFHTGP